MNEKYYIITHDEDGSRIYEFSKEELEEKINKKDSGFCSSNYLDSLKENDPNYWGDDEMLIIKGNIIVPKNKEVIIKKILEDKR